MFDQLFSRSSVIRRHWEGPLAAERAAYLIGLAALGMAHGTILRQSSYCLCVARFLMRWPSGRSFNKAEVELLAQEWATERTQSGHATHPHWPKEQFQSTATSFLRHLGRFAPAKAGAPDRYSAELEDFIVSQKEGRWISASTCKYARWQIRRFLDYLEQRNVGLDTVSAIDIDAYFEYKAQCWSRRSLQTSGKILRAWFRYCQRRCLAPSGLADAILSPRIYRDEGLPMGPTWEAIGKVLDQTSAGDPAALRDHAIILLLSVYGLRSGTVRQLRIDDIDWVHNQIRFVHSKSRHEVTAPLETRVGNAIAQYLYEGRPCSESRTIFLTLRAPVRPLSTGGLYNIVKSRFAKQDAPQRGCGPHGIRHACARHLLESGCNWKEVGDHLGHRCPDSTRIYAKVNLRALRTVAFDDLGALS